MSHPDRSSHPGRRVGSERFREIPSVSDYDHYNEEAHQMWYRENSYDMYNPSDDPGDPYDDYDR